MLETEKPRKECPKCCKMLSRMTIYSHSKNGCLKPRGRQVKVKHLYATSIAYMHAGGKKLLNEAMKNRNCASKCGLQMGMR